MKNPSGTTGNPARDHTAMTFLTKLKPSHEALKRKQLNLWNACRAEQFWRILLSLFLRVKFANFSRQTLSVVPRTTTSIRTLASDLRSIKSIYAKRGHSKSTAFKHRQLDVYNLQCSLLCAQLFLLPRLVYQREYGPSQLQQYARVM